MFTKYLVASIFALFLVGCASPKTVDVDFTTAVNRLWDVHPLGEGHVDSSKLQEAEKTDSSTHVLNTSDRVRRNWRLDAGYAEVSIVVYPSLPRKIERSLDSAVVEIRRVNSNRIAYDVTCRGDGGWFWESNELAAKKWSAIIERIVNGQYRAGEPIVPENK